MSAPAKFLFDVDFSRTETAHKAEPAITLAAHEAALAEKGAQAYQSGFNDAHAEAERRQAAAFEAIASRLQSLAGDLNSVEQRLETEAVEVAFSIARKLSPKLIEQEPVAEIAALAIECFSQLVSAPHVVVRVNEGLCEIARVHLDEIARRSGFEGRLVVLGEPKLALGDCRIEWADGGMVRDHAATEAAITDAVERYITARTGAQASDPGGTRL